MFLPTPRPTPPRRQKRLLFGLLLLAAAGCKSDSATPTECCNNRDFRLTSAHPNLKFLLPNVITPNGDGRNDRFVIVGYEQGSSMQIPLSTFTVRKLMVSRAPKEVPVFRSTNYDNNFIGRDDRGRELGDGSYYYELTLDGTTVTGNIAIVRAKSSCSCRYIDELDPLLP